MQSRPATFAKSRLSASPMKPGKNNCHSRMAAQAATPRISRGLGRMPNFAELFQLAGQLIPLLAGLFRRRSWRHPVLIVAQNVGLQRLGNAGELLVRQLAQQSIVSPVRSRIDSSGRGRANVEVF